MKINSILNRYVFKEMIPPFIINLVFFTFIFLMTKILDITKLIVNYRISISSVLLMLIYAVPHFLEFVIPMSVMMAVLLTFLRLSSDNEIVALKAGGISIYGLIPSVLVFSMMGLILTGFMTVYGSPWGKLLLRERTFQIAVSHANVGLKERTFNDGFKDVMLYINKIDLKSKNLVDVFIEDKSTKNIVSTVVAPNGKLFGEPDKLTFHLRLYNGTINQVDLENRSANSANFDTYDINLDLKKLITSAKGGPKDEDEMSLAELFRYLKDATKKDVQYYATLIEFHKKFSIPFACLALGLLAVPLGVESKSAKRSAGLGFGLIFFLIYYLMLSAGRVFGEAGVYPPVIGMWIPNIVMGGLGLFLLVRTANERPVKINSFLNLFKMKHKESLQKHENRDG
jgi:lipopolysaccharide export system permease protein